MAVLKAACRESVTVIRIYSAASLPEAHLLLHRLRERGIVASVFNENAHGGVGELPFTHVYPEIWIYNPGDEREARMIVGEFECDLGSEANVECTECGEPSPATFEICWHCAAVLDGGPDKP